MLINSTINKTKHKGSIIPHITVNSIKQTNLNKIANSFGKFYSTLGSTLANEIVPGTTPIDRYLEKILRQLNSIRIKLTMPLEIDKIIKELPNKSSHGHDEVSNKMLKGLRPAIMFPLCHIFNQSLISRQKHGWNGHLSPHLVAYHNVKSLVCYVYAFILLPRNQQYTVYQSIWLQV